MIVMESMMIGRETCVPWHRQPKPALRKSFTIRNATHYGVVLPFVVHEFKHYLVYALNRSFATALPNCPHMVVYLMFIRLFKLFCIILHGLRVEATACLTIVENSNRSSVTFPLLAAIVSCVEWPNAGTQSWGGFTVSIGILSLPE